MAIDEIDFAVLRTVRLAENPLWKKQVHEKMMEDRCLKQSKDISVQTVGRRIDELHESGYLDPCIVEPEKMNRDLMIAFNLTGKGERALEDKRDTMLRERAASYTLGPGNDKNYSDATVEELMKSEIGIDMETLERLRDCEPACLDMILAHYYLLEESQRLLQRTDISRVEELLEEDERLEEIASRIPKGDAGT